jgi:hypothetical protein
VLREQNGFCKPFCSLKIPLIKFKETFVTQYLVMDYLLLMLHVSDIINELRYGASQNVQSA